MDDSMKFYDERSLDDLTHTLTLEDIDAMIDVALALRDEEWFYELCEKREAMLDFGVESVSIPVPSKGVVYSIEKDGLKPVYLVVEYHKTHTSKNSKKKKRES